MKTLLSACETDYLFPEHSGILRQYFTVNDATCGLQDHFASLVQQQNPNVVILGHDTGIDEEMLPYLKNLNVLIFPGTDILTTVPKTIQEKLADQGVKIVTFPGLNASGVLQTTRRRIEYMLTRLHDATSLNCHVEFIPFEKFCQNITIVFLGGGSTALENIIYFAKLGIRTLHTLCRPKDEAIAAGALHVQDPLKACEGAHIVSLHIPDTPENIGLFDKAFFEAMATDPDGRINYEKMFGVIDFARPLLIPSNHAYTALSLFSRLHIAYDLYYLTRNCAERSWTFPNLEEDFFAREIVHNYENRVSIGWHTAAKTAEVRQKISSAILKEALLHQ